MAKIPGLTPTNQEPSEKKSGQSLTDRLSSNPQESCYQRNNNPPVKFYIPPRSGLNRGPFYQLPPASHIVRDLEERGGNLDKFLADNADTPELREKLLFAIYQLWGKEENAEAALQWQELLDIYRQTKIAMMEAEVLANLDKPAPEAKKGKGAAASPATKLIVDSILGRNKGSARLGRPPKEPPPPNPILDELQIQESEIIARLRTQKDHSTWTRPADRTSEDDGSP